ncbi:MAG: hypothetical protein C4519_06355 [Desulfobacteraceae bacterium]|nr:MAG: hypothetical protein C4519_06355 [Desulfobacteraceae bacterium]
MDLSVTIKAIAGLGRESAAQTLDHLQPGDRLIGRVLRLDGDGRILLDLGKFRVTAHSEIPFQVGQEIALKVIRTSLPVQLRLDTETVPMASESLSPLASADFLQAHEQKRALEIIDRLLSLDAQNQPAGVFGAKVAIGPADNPEGAAETASKGSLLFPEQVRNALQQLKTFFDPIGPPAPAGQHAQWLRSAVEDRGFLFEIKLADLLEKVQASAGPPQEVVDTPGETFVPGLDSRSTLMQTMRQIVARDLKAQLLILKDFFGDLAGSGAWSDDLKASDTAHLQRTVGQLMSQVEKQQAQAIRRAGEGEVFQIFNHLLQIKDRSLPVRLKVYYPQKSRTGRTDAGHRIAVLLDMDRLGPVRVDLALLERRLSISFYVRDRNVRATFDRHAAAVSNALAGMFDRIQISTHISRRHIVRFDEDDRQGGSTAGGIDLHA